MRLKRRQLDPDYKEKAKTIEECYNEIQAMLRQHPTKPSEAFKI